MGHDIAKLEQRMIAVDQKVKRLESIHSVLGPIVHRPGWMTIAEYDLVHLALDALERHADSLAALQGQLLSAADQVARVRPAQKIAS